MTDPPVPSFTIGRGDWVREMRSYTDTFDPHYWDDFRPWRGEEVTACERAVDRVFPEDFREFLRKVGSGSFAGCGGIYTPDDIALACHGPFLSLLGSGYWAPDDAQRRFYTSRGADNPRPDLFTPESVVVDGLNLFDLLQIGSDGSGCYYQLYLAPPPRPFGFCVLVPSGDIEDRFPSFTDGLKYELIESRRTANGGDDEPRLFLNTDFIIEYE